MVILITCNGTPLQDETNTVVLSTDAEWATCRESRRSNSGGTVMLGKQLIAAWSRVQPRIALSSGEAELYAGFRDISETLGFVHMMREFHTQDWCRIIHRVDASACRAIMLRRGLWSTQAYHRQIFVGSRSSP